MTGTQAHTIGEVTLNYRIEGEGEPLVCIHGVGSYLEAWSGVVERLKDRFTVLTFDLRGHGQSSRVKGRYEIDDFVNETLALADRAGFSTFNLAGFSLGGLIAQRLALTHLQRLRRLALLSTVAGRTPAERERVLDRLAALRSGTPTNHHNASLSRWLTEEFQENNPEVIQRLRARDAENDPDCYAAAYRVLAETDFGGFLDQIRCPTLIVTGEDDVGSNPRMARYMHERIQGSELRILPGLRHSILIEAPEVVAGLMGEFLSQGKRLMDEMLRAGGEAIRRKVLGDDYVDRAIGTSDAFSRPFQDLLNEYCWGTVWTDEGLDLKSRSLLNLGMLAALGRMHEFAIHFRGAIRNGLTDEELRAALVQIAVYCGIPAGVEVFRVARSVRDEMAQQGER